jgi:hypothetical protein
MTIKFDKAEAELIVLRRFIDFINRQLGVYMDCLSGFEGNKVRIERQVARVLHPRRERVADGEVVMMYASLEDPSKLDVIHHRIIRTDEFIAVNSERAFNEQQVCWAIVVFVFAYWDEEVRPAIARIRGVEPNDIKLVAFGDLRTLRRAIVHNGGVVTAAEHAKLRVLNEVAQPEAVLAPSHEDMHRIFIALKQAIAEIILHYTGHLLGAPKASEIMGIAIQGARGEGRVG